jgi:hypothetical protein
MESTRKHESFTVDALAKHAYNSRDGVCSVFRRTSAIRLIFPALYFCPYRLEFGYAAFSLSHARLGTAASPKARPNFDGVARVQRSW